MSLRSWSDWMPPRGFATRRSRKTWIDLRLRRRDSPGWWARATAHSVPDDRARRERRTSAPTSSGFCPAPADHLVIIADWIPSNSCYGFCIVTRYCSWCRLTVIFNRIAHYEVACVPFFSSPARSSSKLVTDWFSGCIVMQEIRPANCTLLIADVGGVCAIEGLPQLVQKKKLLGGTFFAKYYERNLI